MHRHSHWSKVHRPNVPIRLSLVLLPLFSSLSVSYHPHLFLQILFQVLLSRPLPLKSCGVHCSACLTTLSSVLVTVCPTQFNVLLLTCSSVSLTTLSSVLFTVCLTQFNVLLLTCSSVSLSSVSFHSSFTCYSLQTCL